VAICRHCEAENPDASRFCGACGSPLFVDVQRGGDERRVVTALFADLVGSTSIGERLDAEDAGEVVGGAVALMVGIVEDLGGSIHVLAGDGALALFGAPRAHEDDPERAVLAGLGICREIGVYADAMVRNWKLTEFGVRVGIETGLAVLRSSEGGVDAGRAVGDVLNTAARLQSQAAPGTVLVGETTRRAVAAQFEWGVAQEFDLKGKQARILATVALRPSRTRRRSGSRVPVATPLIGRDDELLMIEQSVGDLRHGQGSVVLVSGDPGVGKSRLLSECYAMLVSRAAQSEERALWLEGRCRSYAESQPYAIYNDLLLGWLGLGSDTPAERIAEALSAALAELPPGVGGHETFLRSLLGVPDDGGAMPTVTEPSELQRRTFAAVRWLFSALAVESPVAVVLEDMHWADPTSIALTEQLFPLTKEVPILLVATRRLEMEHLSAELFAATASLPGARSVDLTPLPSERARDLLHALIGDDALPDVIERALLAATDGNPLFLEEQVKALIDRGALVQTGDAWRFIGEATIELPPTIEKVILSRLDRLEPRCRQTLVAASVLGREFSLALLQRVVGGAGAERSDLDELERLSLIQTARERGEPGFRFAHALIQETAYRNLLRRTRRELHRRAAEALETQQADRLDEAAGTIGYHLAQAGESERAIPYLVSAGDRAKVAYANDEAITNYRLALTLVDNPDDAGDRTQSRTWQCDLFERLGVVLALVSRYDEARDAYTHGLSRLADADGVREARLHSLTGGVENAAHEFAEALARWDLAEAALGPLSADADAEWLATWITLQQGRITTLYWLGDTDELEVVVQRVRPVVEKRGTATQRGELFAALTILALRRDRYVAAPVTVEYARAALVAALEGGNRETIAWRRFSLGFTLLWAARLDEADALLSEALAEADRMGEARLRSRCATYLLVAARKRGDVQAVSRNVTSVIEAAKVAKLPEYEALALANEAWVAWRTGDRDRVLEAGRAALQAWQALPIRYWYDWMALWPMTAVSADRDEWDDAIANLRGMLSPDQQPLPDQLRNAVAATVEAWDAGREDDGRRRLNCALGIARERSYL
jgi:class 3 adenylate cyclase